VFFGFPLRGRASNGYGKLCASVTRSSRRRNRVSIGQWKASEPCCVFPANAGRHELAPALVGHLGHSIVRPNCPGPSRPAKVESSLRRYHSSDIRRQTFDDSWTQCGSSDGQVTVRSTSSAARVSRRWRKRDFRNTVSDKQTQAYLRVESKPSGQTSRCWCGPKGSANCWARFEVPLVRREGCHDSWRRSGP
jgi:hypothetical protein